MTRSISATTPPSFRLRCGNSMLGLRSDYCSSRAKACRPNPLYHYTDEFALRGILTNQQIWCFRHLHQRDRTEFAYSLAIARRVIKEVGTTDEFFWHHFCGCLDDLLENNSLVDAFEFYLFSLSRHRDDRRHWLEYGDKARGLWRRRH
jgi:hypothetical protein